MTTKNWTGKYFTADRWNIGYVQQSPEDLIKTQALAPNVHWLKEDTSQYSADPFIMHINSKPIIYYEHLSYWKALGEICLIRDFDFKSKQIVAGMPQGIHLSYPYIYSEGERVYCIPETSKAGEVSIYEIELQGPNLLNKLKVLLNGQNFVDTSLIKYNNLYWLFTSISGSSNELLIFYSDSIFGDFKPHALNPISSDLKNLRGAGSLFIVDGTLYWPSQNHEKNYGGSIIINRIDDLTETSFAYTRLFEILPIAPYTSGIHNISFSGDLIVVDGRRRIKAVWMPFSKGIKKWKQTKF
ncbi:MAG TPA: hypothetical protein VEV16_12785 [Daejeonella sp.]|nr:hypothetical protein [Daejeonella sp.]